MKFNTFITGKYGAADGAVEITENEIVVFRKSAFTRTFFGAVGTAIAAGKEVGRFTRNDVATYDVQEKTLKNVAVLTFRDGSSLSFTMKSDLTDAFKAFMNRSSSSDPIAESTNDYVDRNADLNDMTVLNGAVTAGTSTDPSKKKPVIIAGICFAFAALWSAKSLIQAVIRYGLSTVSLIEVACLVMIAVGIFTSQHLLSANSSGILALSEVSTLINTLRSASLHIVILEESATVVFWVFLTLAFACKKNKRALFFAAGIAIALRVVYDLISGFPFARLIRILDLIAMCIAAFVLSTQKSENV